MKNVVLCYPVEPRHVLQFQDGLPECNIIDAGQDGVAEKIMEADIFVGHAKVPVDWESVVDQGRLELIQSSAAGLDHCLVPSVVDSDIAVCSASGLFANQVGEQTLALLLGVLRSMPVFFRQSLVREFVRRPTDDLRGKRIGIVGLGGNGRRLVELLAPFDVSIWATDYYPVRQPPEVERLLPADGLGEMAARSDILILALPLNKSTRELVSEDVLRSMPSGSYLINVARGQVVDERALGECLADGQLKAAGVDVTFEEPLPAESPLWGLDNVMITPHVGAQAATRVDDSTRFAVANLQRFLRGDDLQNVVDKMLGFPHPDVMSVNQ
ncbi:MAG: D-2-hydroxyacid dehydrogenase [Aureliella sp.]